LFDGDFEAMFLAVLSVFKFFIDAVLRGQEAFATVVGLLNF